MSNISGIIQYKPEELYITVKAGTPIKIVKTDFSFKRDQSSPKHEFSSVKLPDHLEKIRRKQRSLKKSSKKRGRNYHEVFTRSFKARS